MTLNLEAPSLPANKGTNGFVHSRAHVLYNRLTGHRGDLKRFSTDKDGHRVFSDRHTVRWYRMPWRLEAGDQFVILHHGRTVAAARGEH